MIARPWCTGKPGRRHPRQTMRVEIPHEAAVAIWRCPDCWHSTPIVEQEPIESRAARADCSVALISNQVADELRVASTPVRLQIEPTDRPPIVEITVKTA